jgi:inosine-uridine nucleoside N-ribohydrolase
MSLASSKVIIDTDPGVDDALALLFAMSSPELKIEAITTVAGNVPLELTLLNALRMVEIAGRADIPVAAGAVGPLVRRRVAATSHGTNGLGDLDFPVPTLKPSNESATEILHRIVSGSPGEVSLIALGPLTNIASAFRTYPILADQVREIVLMGGSLSGGNMTPAAEFNMYVDPEAADIVFRSGVALTMIGLDVTRKCLLTAARARALEAGVTPVCQAAERIARNDLERARHADCDGRPMHDPLAVAAFIDRTLVTLRPYHVAIETRGEYTAGQTLGYAAAPVRRSAPHRDDPDESETSSPFAFNASVAVDVDADAFFRKFAGRLSGR